MVIHPASSLHYVQPVTRGMRLAAIFWIRSLVRNNDDRQILLDLDIAIQRIRDVNPGDPVDPFDYRRLPQFTGAMVRHLELVMAGTGFRPYR
jgi:hypothetical protein